MVRDFQNFVDPCLVRGIENFLCPGRVWFFNFLVVRDRSVLDQTFFPYIPATLLGWCWEFQDLCGWIFMSATFQMHEIGFIDVGDKWISVTLCYQESLWSWFKISNVSVTWFQLLISHWLSRNFRWWIFLDNGWCFDKLLFNHNRISTALMLIKSND